VGPLVFVLVSIRFVKPSFRNIRSLCRHSYAPAHDAGDLPPAVDPPQLDPPTWAWRTVLWSVSRAGQRR